MVLDGMIDRWYFNRPIHACCGHHYQFRIASVNPLLALSEQANSCLLAKSQAPQQEETILANENAVFLNKNASPIDCSTRVRDLE
jgi:hypothetical protein